MSSTKENTLSLAIGKDDFQQIEAGELKQVFREIKDTTANKYLLHFEDMLYVAPGSWSGEDEPDDIMVYNNGVYPFLPIEYKYLNLSAGSALNKKELLIEVNGFGFQPAVDESGNVIRMSWNEKNGFVENKNGDLAAWFIIYQLGNIVKNKE